jgi:hypothetical protein
MEMNDDSNKTTRSVENGDESDGRPIAEELAVADWGKRKFILPLA